MTTPSQPQTLSLEAILDNPHFPAPPAIALRIVDKASQPDCDPAEILSLLKQDPGLCGRIFKTVNSCVFGLAKPIASLDRAVMVLGVKPLRSLVLGLSLSSVRTRDNDPLVGQYWRESVSGAVIARDLAVKLRRPSPDDDFLAALLRDLGILVLSQLFPEEYRELWANLAKSEKSQCELEQAAFGLDHAEISAGIVDSWRMPDEIAVPIRHHHAIERLEGGSKEIVERTKVLYFASKMARLENRNSSAVAELLRIARAQFGMDYAALLELLGLVTPKIQELANILKVEIGQCPDYPAILAAGCEELVKLSVEKGRDAVAPIAPTTLADPEQTHGILAPGARPSRATRVVGGKTTTMPVFDVSCFDKRGNIGSILDGYEIQEVVGRGAMGVVFRAFDSSLQRVVAVKMLKPERLVSSEARERFTREARASAAIQHPNVVTIYAVSEFNGLPYLVMELLAGASLQEVLDKQPKLPMPEVISFAHQLASGLHAAHVKRIVHRDIKPANILVEKATGTLKITDFGLARLDDGSNLSQSGMMVGTPLYMAPEQFDGKKADHRADLYSFGGVVYALCAGVPPFHADSVMALMKKVCDATPAPLRTMRPDAPTWLENLVMKLLAKTPGGRIASAAEILRIIESHANIR